MMAVVGLELISFFPNEWSPSSGSVSIVSDTGRPVSLLTSVTVTSLSGVALMRYDSAPLADLYWLNRLLILIGPPWDPSLLLLALAMPSAEGCLVILNSFCSL